MKTTPLQDCVEIQRITVDERLTENLLRIEVCRLAHSEPEFADRSGEWMGATAVLVRSDNYLEVMGIPRAEADLWPWEGMTEGMAFISGSFEPVEEESALLPFRVAPEQWSFVRIDNLRLSRDATKEVYAQLLQTGGPHEHAD